MQSTKIAAKLAKRLGMSISPASRAPCYCECLLACLSDQRIRNGLIMLEKLGALGASKGAG